jgi:signal transduction histidine kinase
MAFIAFLFYTGKVYLSRQKLLQKTQLIDKIQEERQRISRDLHDNIGAHLSFIVSSAENTLYKTNTDKAYLINKLREIKVFAANTIDLFRDTIWALNEENITTKDLINRLQVYIEKIKKTDETISINIIDYLPNTYPLNPMQTINLYRTLQEAILNAVKYANTDKIDINFSMTKQNKLCIKVFDNGKGFDQSIKSKGYGINNMKRRITNLNGKLNIESNKGTHITITIPLLE